MAEEKTKNERDDFWDIGALVPPRRRATPAASEHTDPVEIEIDLPRTANASEDEGRGAEIRVPAAPAAQKSAPPQAERVPERPSGADGGRRGERRTESASAPSAVFEPVGSLIKSIRVYDWSANYAYYESFRQTAMRVAGMRPAAGTAAHVPFFSYVPQYSQLSDSRLAYYLWMRAEICAGRFPESDYSYILLYVYELINLSDLNDPALTLRRLCDVWREYHVEHAHLNVNLLEWICDFCLIHGMSAPLDLLGETSPSVFRSTTLKEFFISSSGEDSFASLVMSFCTNYDYRTSKYAAGENRAVYDRCMEGAVRAAFGEGEGIWNDPALRRCRSVRDAYVGALCSPKVKKRMEIEYLSFSHSHELRFLTTDVMKYAENKIRAALGVKSRLKVGNFQQAMKEAVDRYFEAEFPSRRRPRAEELPEYERLYEPAGAGLSADSILHAESIESDSWMTTEKLIEAFEGEISETSDTPETPGETQAAAPENIPATPKKEPEKAPEKEPEKPAFAAVQAQEPADAASGDAVLTPTEREYLAACLAGDRAAQARAAARDGRLPDALADAINEKSTDWLGDILLEPSADGRAYRVIEDYTEDAAAWCGAQPD